MSQDADTSSETGQLFSIATALMLNEAGDKVPKAEMQGPLRQLTTFLGRCFQIRDDYQNLVSADVSTPNVAPTRLEPCLLDINEDTFTAVCNEEGILRRP